MSSCPCLICADATDLDAIDRDSVENVRRYGWSVMMIPEDEHGPGWAFTIGLRHTRGTPDLIMCGLDLDLMHECLNILGEAESVPAPEQRREDVLEGHAVLVKTVDPSWHPILLGSASSFYQHAPMEVLQVVWPDKDGRFPGDEDVAEWAGELQPLLWIAKDRHPAGPWTELD